MPPTNTNQIQGNTTGSNNAQAAERQRAGRPISASNLNKVVDAVATMSRPVGGGRQVVGRGGKIWPDIYRCTEDAEADDKKVSAIRIKADNEDQENAEAKEYFKISDVRITKGQWLIPVRSTDDTSRDEGEYPLLQPISAADPQIYKAESAANESAETVTAAPVSVDGEVGDSKAHYKIIGQYIEKDELLIAVTAKDQGDLANKTQLPVLQSAGPFGAKSNPESNNFKISGERSGAANTNSWDVASQGEGKTGIEITICTGVGFDGTTLEAWTRDFKFDAKGNLVEVSAESKYTIDEPEDCDA